MAKLTINLNDLGIFSGCYETIWLNSEKDTDLIMEMESDLGCEVKNEFDFYKYLKGVAEIYQEYLENELGGTFTIDEIYSPKEYNFETDTIVFIWEKENLSETQMQKLLDDKFEALDDSELNDIETYDIYDHFYGYELYDSLNRFYVIDEQGNEKDVYFGDGKYVAE